MRKIYKYISENGTSPVDTVINEAGEKFIKKYNFLMEYIRNENNCLCEPYVKHFCVERYRRLYELRLRINGSMIRVIFLLTDNDNVILLHAFYKRDKRDTEKALEYALRLLNSLDLHNISSSDLNFAKGFNNK